MKSFATLADVRTIEAEMPWAERDTAHSMHDFLTRVRDRHPDRPAISFQLFSAPSAPAQTLTWAGLHGQVTQAANLFRSLGVTEDKVVAFVLPNCLETAVTLLGGAAAGIVNPINPLLDHDQIAAILRQSRARVVVTLKAFPKTDLAQKVALALRHAPEVQTVVEVDLRRSLTGVKRLILPLVRPKHRPEHGKQVIDFARALARQPADSLTFPDGQTDRVAAYFHTGGTTGLPKVAQHKISGMVYNGWLGARLLFQATDTILCPLPLFHVFAAYPILMSAIASGAHVVFPTPAGYRGEGVFDNLWRLVERWRCSYLITVPTALAALMQRPINADISSLKHAFSGSAPLPVELYNRFKRETGVEIVEGYGLTEATCLVAVNPPEGIRKIGSVGLPFPYTHVRILQKTETGFRPCATDEVGEICVASPGVFEGSTYTELDRNRDLFAEGRFLRTGDLGRIDADGYLFITGRAKDLIIRGGHNIDPALIEEALMTHEAVAMVGAIGQPDPHSGELPCAYVELVKGRAASIDDLLDHARRHIPERAAHPRHVEILGELPKTAVGKVFKPDLRRLAVQRVYDETFAAAGLPLRVAGVIEDRKRGLVVQIARDAAVTDETAQAVLGRFTLPWEWAD